MALPDLSAGLCTSHPHPGWWTSDNATERKSAIAVCQACPLVTQCAEWSLQFPAYGDTAVFGGLLPSQRVSERKRRKAATQAARLAAVPAGGARHNAAKAECDHGHKLSGANLVMVRDPRDGKVYRQCRACRKARKRVSARLRSQRDREAVNARKRAAYAARKAAAGHAA